MFLFVKNVKANCCRSKMLPFCCLKLHQRATLEEDFKCGKENFNNSSKFFLSVENVKAINILPLWPLLLFKTIAEGNIFLSFLLTFCFLEKC